MCIEIDDLIRIYLSWLKCCFCVFQCPNYDECAFWSVLMMKLTSSCEAKVFYWFTIWFKHMPEHPIINKKLVKLCSLELLSNDISIEVL